MAKAVRDHDIARIQDVKEDIDTLLVFVRDNSGTINWTSQLCKLIVFA